jgi:hypothetical protein
MIVVRRVYSRNLMNEVALIHFGGGGLSRQQQTNRNYCSEKLQNYLSKLYIPPQFPLNINLLTVTIRSHLHTNLP